MIACGLYVVACTPTPERLSDFTPLAADSAARHVVLRVATGDSAFDEALVDPVMRTAETQGVIQQLRGLTAGRSVGPVKLVGSKWERTGGRETRTLVYEAPLEIDALSAVRLGEPQSVWFVAEVALRETGGRYKVTRLHVNVAERSLQALNSFSGNLGIAQGIWLVMTALVLAIIAFAVVQVIRTPMPHRWVWVFVSLIGVSQGTINWTTGATAYQPLWWLLFGAAIGRSGLYGPWMLSLSFPAGAFWALNVVRIKRAQLARRQCEAGAEAPHGA